MTSSFLASRGFSRLSTSLKILIILSLALLPLGLIASLASLETADANRANRVAAARLLATDSAERLNLALDRSASLLRDALREGAAGCGHAARAIGDGAAVAAFDGQGRTVCASRTIAMTLPLRPADTMPIVVIDQGANAVRLLVHAADRPGWGLAVLPAGLLTDMAHPLAPDSSYAMTIDDDHGQSIRIADLQSFPVARPIMANLPIADGQLRMRITVAAQPLSANEILLTILPLLMWVAGAAIGWLVVDRLILKPLATMQTSIDTYRLTGRFEPPPITTPAFEIRTLARAFQLATRTIRRHEVELEEGLARQIRLTREVHHRVKNNLQVVASLLNIRARGARTREAADAYATIQRRVDALALVHRSHYAELEVNLGVALRPLIGELAANLRGSLPAGLAAPAITLRLAPASVHQDVAVSIAFLLVEVIETAMLRLPGAAIAISCAILADRPDRARLEIVSPALRADAAPIDDQFELFERVAGGLARQLRTPLERDDAAGRIAVEIALMAEAADG